MRAARPLDRYEVDIALFVRVHAGLKAALQQVRSAEGLTRAQRGRWQRRLEAISDSARRDLPEAERALTRLVQQWTSLTGLPPLQDVEATLRGSRD